MITNLENYFESGQEIYLDSIRYNRMESEPTSQECQLNGVDTIETQLGEDVVRVTVKRMLTFSPDAIFKLEITFGAVLRFVDEKKKEQDWEKINLAEEFRENGYFVLENLLSRISLLTAQVTSSCGQPPIILKPEIAPK